MATAEQTYLRTELEERRERLHAAVHGNHADSSLSRLLTEVDAALARIGEGSYGVCVSCKGAVESDRLLADPLLKVCLECLTQEEQRGLENDLSLAKSIQRALLPRNDFTAAGWQVCYHYEPAALVSGDYCDLIETPYGLLFLLGDVSGKGVAASMLMSHLNATFRSLAATNLSLEKTIEAANRIFCESTLASQYATLIVGHASADGLVEFASAGHPPLLHVCGEGVASIEATGVPLGMFRDARFPVSRLSLRPGESLLLYTDGLTEAENQAGEPFGMDRIARLAACCSASAPNELLAECLSNLRHHLGDAKRSDDLTLLVLRREV